MAHVNCMMLAGVKSQYFPVSSFAFLYILVLQIYIYM
jgi:hypothetical protein